MSKVIFINCSNKDCKYGKSYPVEAGNEEVLAKCPQCDPKAHRAIKNAKQQSKMISNKAVRQNLDAGKVESLEAGFAALKQAGANLEDGADGLGVEVDHTPVKSEAGAKIKIPTVDMTPQQKAAITRAKNAALKAEK